MTEKQIKLPNKKGKHVKAKKQLAKKVVSSDSEFSDSNGLETSEKDIKKISADVSQMLANLKKEHGLEDDDGPLNKKKKPNENKNIAGVGEAKQPKTKPEAKYAAQKNQQQQQKPGNQQQKKKNESKKQLAGNEQNGAVQQKQQDNVQDKNDKKAKAKPVKDEQNTVAQSNGQKNKNKKAKQPQGEQNTDAQAAGKKNKNNKKAKQPQDEQNTDAQAAGKKNKNKKAKQPQGEQNTDAQAAGEKNKNKKAKKPQEKQTTDAQAAGKKNKKNKKAKQPQSSQETATDDVVVKEEPASMDLATKPLSKKKNSKKSETQKLISDVVVKAQNESEDEKPAAGKLDEHKKDYYLKDASPICVTNLPTNIKRKQVLREFKKFGKVLAIRFRTNTGKSFLNKVQLKGVPFLIAFIYFDTLEAAKASLIMNNEIFFDNKISVDLDSRDITNKVKPKSTILVGNLKYAVTQPLLHETFSCCGKIDHIRVIQTNRGCKGVAFVCFESPESVALALELDKTLLLDRPMHVERFKEAKLKRSDKIKLKSVKKLKIKNKKPGAVNKSPTNNNNQIQGKSPNKKLKSPKEGKKKNKEFQGVKSNETKKAHLTKNKKKKLKMHHEKRMALKIAPKEEKQTE